MEHARKMHASPSSAGPRGTVAASKDKLLASAAEPSRPQPESSVEQAASPPVQRSLDSDAAQRAPLPIGAYSIPQFCAAHAISESFFHKLRKQGRGPPVIRLGARTLITIEAATRWRAEQKPV
jgi:hypothetical protein